MPKQRDKVRMSEAEVAAFLDGCKSLNVATLNKNGAPHLTTLWFATEDDNILFETYGTSQKVANLRHDPRIAVLCEQGTTYDQLRGVSVQGTAEIVDSGPRLESLMARIVARNHAELPPEALIEQARTMARKRVVIIVHPDRIMSWDHRKLAGP